MKSSAAVAPGLANGHAPYRPTQATPDPVPISGPTSPQSSMLATGQQYLLFPSFTLESGITLKNVPVAYKTWGKLDEETRDNVLVVAHALTGSADVEDWWGPLLGPGKLFDPTRYFIFCANVLGSPYGSGGPCTRKGGENIDEETGKHVREPNWDGQGWWGPEFPATTVRDDVRIQKLVLDYLGVERIAACVGGSMGGMSVLEWPLCFPVRFPQYDLSQLDDHAAGQSQKPYISCIIPIATAARHGAWCISWAEAQRQSIYSDPLYLHGYYAPDKSPRAGLAAARMAALLTYRSRDSFESRFGRRIGAAAKGGGAVAAAAAAARAKEGTQDAGDDAAVRRASVAEEAARAHNEGNLSPRPTVPSGESKQSRKTGSHFVGTAEEANRGEGEPKSEAQQTQARPPSPIATGATATSTAPVFSAQSYLRYQGDKFVRRFDANCYVHLTRKMDTHDLARGRAHWGLSDPREAAQKAVDAEREAAAQHSDEAEVLKGEKRLPHGGEEDDEALARVLAYLGRGTGSGIEAQGQGPTRQGGAPPPFVHVVSISSDGLFQTPEQKLIHQLIPGSTFQEVPSPEGHDGFLLEFEAIGTECQRVLQTVGPQFYEGQGVGWEEWKNWGSAEEEQGAQGGAGHAGQQQGEGKAKVKESVFGEVEDLTRW